MPVTICIICDKIKDKKNLVRSRLLSYYKKEGFWTVCKRNRPQNWRVRTTAVCRSWRSPRERRRSSRHRTRRWRFGTRCSPTASSEWATLPDYRSPESPTTSLRSEENHGKNAKNRGKQLKKWQNSRQNYGIKFLSFLSLKHHLGLWCT